MQLRTKQYVLLIKTALISSANVELGMEFTLTVEDPVLLEVVDLDLHPADQVILLFILISIFLHAVNKELANAVDIENNHLDITVV